ncbi:hypothetical protein [Glycomyces salinus]|uniref:hypothetical protein n=1 Tax=Glycomyces salinus TaxID=980294 RepID=UPI0018EAEF6E|nr:hypothetical protein [Glycomyces salinus]
MAPDELEVGEAYTRPQLQEIFGGALYSGIVPSRSTPNILLFSDPSKGVKYGYHDEPGEDEFGDLYLYTGEGRTGDQQMTKGNKAILNHVKERRALRLFLAVSKIPGSGTKIHQYFGEFKVDPVEPCVRKYLPVEGGVARKMLIFQLRPVGDAAIPPPDQLPIPAGTGLTEVFPEPSRPTKPESSAELVSTENNLTPESDRRAVEGLKLRRREAALVERFERFLEQHGHVPKRYQLTIAGVASVFPTDVFDVTANVLYEAKGTAARNSIRLAIGQLFDYSRHIDPKPSRLAILLPEMPSPDLQELIRSVGMSLVYEDGDSFAGWPVAPG